MAESNLFEQMLAAYPAEKRDLARAVYQRFAGGESTEFFTQLFLVLDVYAHYAERIPKAVVEANEHSLAACRDLREELERIAHTLESRDLVSPWVKRAEELAARALPALEKVERASREASSLWAQRIGRAAVWHGVVAGLLTALAASLFLYWQFHDYYERKTARQIVYAERLMNYNQEAFRQLAIAQAPIKVLRTESYGVINQGFALELQGADSVELRPEEGRTNGYVFFSSHRPETMIEKLEAEARQIENQTQRLGAIPSP